MTEAGSDAVEIFYSYAHEDEELLKALKAHMSSLRREGLIEEWYDREIIAGSEWAREIDSHINTAHIILLLISADFMASDYCYGIEMKRAMERHHTEKARVIPIILRDVDWAQAPFSKLQALPGGAIPVKAWPDRDSAFVTIVQGIRKVIEQMRDARTRLDPTRLPNAATRYFMTLEEYLKPSERRFPTEQDFSRDLVYLPEQYTVQIRELLRTKRRVLLTGSSATGKTVLAVALARQLQITEGYKVAYKDISSCRDGEGARWYELMHAYDRAGLNILYILDNCHLAAEEVDSFCFQWQGQPLQQVQCMLISHAAITGPGAQIAGEGNYFEDCADETITLQFEGIEDIWWGMLKKYEAAYRKENSDDYLPIEKDTALRFKKLQAYKKQRAHNLVFSRSRLQAWHKCKGALSAVKTEDVYEELIDKYLPPGSEALPTLCALRQYEIDVHYDFIKQLPAEEIQRLMRQGLLIHTRTPRYGELYELVFHPAEAREIFEADVYRLYGQFGNRATEAIKKLTAYLRSNPTNSMQAYKNLVRELSRSEQERILKPLVVERELQAVMKFNALTPMEAIRYIEIIHKFDQLCAAEMLDKFLSERDVQQLVQALNVQDLWRFHDTMQRISELWASTFLNDIPPQLLADKATAGNFASLMDSLQKRAYSRERDVVAGLNMTQITQQAEKEKLQPLMWLHKALKEYDPQRAEELLTGISQQVLTTKTAIGDLQSIEKLVLSMHKASYTSAQIEELIDSIGIAQILKRAEREKVQRLYGLLLALHQITQATVDRILETLTPASLASLCCAPDVTVEQVRKFRNVTARPFWQQLLRAFSAADFAALFQRSKLGALGMFLQHQYRYENESLREGYAQFQRQFLRDKLAEESLEEIGRFLHRIRLVPDQGEELARDILQQLVTVDLAERVANSNLEQYALLLLNARSLDDGTALRLLEPLNQPGVLEKALENTPDHSTIEGIQKFIHDASEIDSRHKYIKPALERVLPGANIEEKLSTAPIKAVARFLWNVYEHVNRNLALAYCQHVDTHPRSEQLRRAEMNDVGLLLWNLTSMSNQRVIHTLEDPVVAERFTAAWRSQDGQALVLLGIASLTRPRIDWHIGLPPLNQKALIVWLATRVHGQNPYTLALTFQGLRHYNEETASELARLHVPISEAIHILKGASEKANSDLSKRFLGETLEWIKELERTKE